MAKNRYKRVEKVFSISLGAGCRGFKSLHSGHKGTLIMIRSESLCFAPHLKSKLLASRDISTSRKLYTKKSIPRQSDSAGDSTFIQTGFFTISCHYKVCEMLIKFARRAIRMQDRYSYARSDSVCNIRFRLNYTIQ